MTTVSAEPHARKVLDPSSGAAARRRGGWRAVRYTILIVSLIVVLIPVYVLFVTSFKGMGDATPSRTWFFPQNWTGENWAEAWAALSPSLLRTFAMVIPAAVLSAGVVPAVSTEARMVPPVPSHRGRRGQFRGVRATSLVEIAERPQTVFHFPLVDGLEVVVGSLGFDPVEHLL